MVVSQKDAASNSRLLANTAVYTDGIIIIYEIDSNALA
jgi:hypothetical protein